jgi:protease YdgD
MIAGCGNTAGNDSGSKNIFGSDDRQPITATQSPWSAIGRLSNGCTATLIDTRLILTAAHCVFNPDGSWTNENMTFSPNMISGSARHTVGTERVWYGTRTPYSDSASVGADWAIYLLDTDLGSTYGWVGVKDYNPSNGDYISVAGYSADYDGGYTATVHLDCRVQGRDPSGNFYHDCDMTRGSSGGPVFASFGGSSERVIVGVQSGEKRNGGETSLSLSYYEEGYANNGVPASAFFRTALELVNTY